MRKISRFVIRSSWLIMLGTLAACQNFPPPQAFANRDPETLLDVSTEVVNMSLAQPTSLAELMEVVSADPPTRALLECAPADANCAQAKAVFDKHGIATQWGQGSAGVTLFYERVTARDCDSRYVDNSSNPYNLHPMNFGCSVAGNTVQMVSQKQEFVSPNLLDFMDGQKAAQAYGQAEQPPQQGDKKMDIPVIGSLLR